MRLLFERTLLYLTNMNIEESLTDDEELVLNIKFYIIITVDKNFTFLNFKECSLKIKVSVF